MSGVVRNSKNKLTAWFTPATIRVGLAGGIVYATIALWVYSFIRQESFWGLFFPVQYAGAVALVYVIIGLLVLGGVSVALLYRNRLVSPLVVLVSLFSWVAYRSWQSFEAARAVGADPGVSFRPDAAFMALWFIPLGIVLCFALVESLIRRTFGPLGTASD